MGLLNIFSRRKTAEQDILDMAGDRESFTGNENESYWSIVKKQFKKNKIAVWSLRIVYVFVFIALLADFLANEKPIAAKYQGEVYFPVFKEYAVEILN